MTRHHMPDDRRAQQPLPTDWKTILSVGAMVVGLYVGVKTDITGLSKDVERLEKTSSRIEANSVTKYQVAEIVRGEMRQAQADADEAIKRASDDAPERTTPRFTKRRATP